MILEFLSNPWISLVAWLLGIISGILQVKSYLEQKSTEKGYLAILEQAKMDWEGKYTEEQIKILANELVALEQKIERDIPKQARQIFLESQMDELIDSIGKSYSEYSQLSRELDDITTNEYLDPEITSLIEKSIMPAHIARKHETQRLQWFLGVAVIILLIVNWDYLIGLLHSASPKAIRVNYRAYPSSWLYIYSMFSLIFAWLINRTKLGKVIEKISTRIKDSIRNKNNIKEKIVSVLLQIEVIFVSTIATVGLPILYANITVDMARHEYFSNTIPMPLNSIPITTIIAIPLAIVLLFIFNFYGRELKRRLFPAKMSHRP
jgi:hypothetical protein